MEYRFLLEASGSLTSFYLIKAIQAAKAKAVASDIMECAAMHLADDFIIFPKHHDPRLWEIMEEKMKEHHVNMVIPSFDETLLDWSKKKKYFLEKGIHVILSDEESIALCQDKWETYLFFEKHGIPTPKTSLEWKYGIVKPRLGRGGKGIFINPDKKDVPSMEGLISQELLSGQEYTIDVFCDVNGVPVYIIPRKRMQVKEGKSLNGITVNNSSIIDWVKKICKATVFTGPINMQCFELEDGSIKFTEINPRIAGGMALGFAASENWIPLIIKNIIQKEKIEAMPVKYGLKMFRYYDEVFAS